MELFKLIRVDYHYCDYLREFDSRVLYNSGRKILRPYIGVLFTLNNMEYFAPLSSPKPKHLKMSNSVDFLKIQNGELGAINFNNMIPVLKDFYEVIDLKTETGSYVNILRGQLRWLNRRTHNISRHASRLYKGYITNELNEKTRSRCCNFPLLEEKCREFEKLHLRSKIHQNT